MKYMGYKTNPTADYGWDWEEHLIAWSVMQETSGNDGFGPMKRNRALLDPGDIIICYDIVREVVFLAYAATGQWRWDEYEANDGSFREGWFAPGVTLAIAGTELTEREVRHIKSTGRVCFFPMQRAIGDAIYKRLMTNAWGWTKRKEGVA